MLRLPALGMALTMMAPGITAAQQGGFDPEGSCGAQLRSAPAETMMLVGAWLSGYLSAQDGANRPVTVATLSPILKDFFTLCQADEGLSIAAVAAQMSALDAPEPGSEADARALLQRFLLPGADLTSLTARLIPTEGDIRAVYAPPLSDALVDMYRDLLKPGAQIGPKPDQNALLVVHTSTGALRLREPVLKEFPGGYERVTGFFVGDHPIVRFKFVTAGETLGLAFDGLIHVGGRWVLMPKPWRALE